MSDDFQPTDGFSLERAFKAGPQRVFDAFADPQARKIWGTPSPEVVLRYESNDFREGGRDAYWCVIDGAPMFYAETHYHEIRAPHRLTHVEHVNEGDTPIFVIMTSIDIRAHGEGSKLCVDFRAFSLTGEDALAGPRQGWELVLPRLAEYLDGRD